MFLFLCVAVLSLVANSQCSLLMFPSSDTKLHLYEAANLTFTVEADQPLDDVVLTLTSSDPSVVQLDSASMQISQLIPGENFSALLTPLQIGYADLAWEFVDKIGNDSSAGIHSMRVVREQTAFAMGFGAIIGLLVALNNVNVGCQLDMQVVLAQLKKPVAPTIGMLGQFVFMPLVSRPYTHLTRSASQEKKLTLSIRAHTRTKRKIIYWNEMKQCVNLLCSQFCSTSCIILGTHTSINELRQQYRILPAAFTVDTWLAYDVIAPCC